MTKFREEFGSGRADMRAYYENDFEEDVELARIVHGKEHRGGMHPTKQLQLGKSVNIGVPLQATVQAFQEVVRVGPLAEPRQWAVTMAPPGFVSLPGGVIPADPQTIGGFMTNIQQAAAGVNTHWANVEVELEWGVGSVVQRARCDANNGLCINLTAQYVIVRARIVAPDGGGGMDQGVAYQVGAHIGPGNNSGGRARLTLNQLIPSNQAAGFETPVLAIPQFAKSVTVMGTTSFNDIITGQIRFWRSLGGSADDRRIAEIFFSASDPQPVPVPNGAYFMSFVLGIPSTIAGTSMQYVFDLAI